MDNNLLLEFNKCEQGESNNEIQTITLLPILARSTVSLLVSVSGKNLNLSASTII